MGAQKALGRLNYQRLEFGFGEFCEEIKLIHMMLSC
jgi:hypothetical protein